MKDCKDCKFHTGGEELKKTNISLFAHEADMERQARHFKAIIRTICIAFATIICVGLVLGVWAWTAYDYSSEETVYTYQQDGAGVNNEVQNGAESDNP